MTKFIPPKFLSYLTTSARADSDCIVPMSAKISSSQIPMEPLEAAPEHLTNDVKES